MDRNWCQASDNPSIVYIPLTGPSMLPTLHPWDLLEVLPYRERAIHEGDVVVFISPKKNVHVVHRAVRVDSQGIRTSGDNNLYEDSVLLQPSDLVGRVIAAWRGPRRRKVPGGLRGRLVARVVRVGHWLYRINKKNLRRFYHSLARSGLFRRLLPHFLRPRVVRFGTTGKPQLLLIMKGHSIGRYDPVLSAWRIQRPFKLFMDEAALPVIGDSIQRVADSRQNTASS